MADLDCTLQLARKYVEEYTKHDEVMAQHYAMMEKCDACEKLLRLGVNAHKWLRQADETFREAARQGIEVSAESRDALEFLYRGWLKPCGDAEKLIQKQKDLGYTPDNLGEFRLACEDVERRVRLLDMDKALDDASQGVVFDAGFWAAARKTRTP